MFYKRPSFRMGSKPTGIETLSPRVGAKEGIFDFIKGPYFTNPDFKVPSIPYIKGGGFEFLKPTATVETLAETIMNQEKKGPPGIGGFKFSAPFLSIKSPDKKKVTSSTDELGFDEGDIQFPPTGVIKPGQNGDDPNTDIPDPIVKEKEKTKSKAEKVKEEADVLKEILGETNISKGEKALILAKAIGTPGTLKDKSDAISGELLKLAASTRGEKKKLAEKAYDTVTKREMRELELSTPTGTAKTVNEITKLKIAQGDNRDPNLIKLEVFDEIINKSDYSEKSLQQFYLAQLSNMNIPDLLYEINRLEKKAKRSGVEQRNLENYRKQIETAKRLAKAGGVNFDTIGLADGGRVGFRDGTQIGQMESKNINEDNQVVPMQTVQKLSFEDLRSRLPQEISNDIVQLLANSQEALADFAYIKTQNDVNDFNVKYGVNLVLPPETV